jgi:hypothetical protein
MPTDIEPKSIQVFPRDTKMDERVNELAAQLRTSRAGLAALSLEFVVEALTSGKAKVENGVLMVLKPSAKAA